MSQDDFRCVVSSMPGSGGQNPYIDMYFQALRSSGVILSTPPEISLEWVETNLSGIDALHFHWPEYIWRDRYPRRSVGSVARFLRALVPGAWRFLDYSNRLAQSPRLRVLQNYRRKWLNIEDFSNFLRVSHSRNVSVIWTLHNLESHEHWDFLDRRGFSVLARAADLIICHSQHARDACLRKYRPHCPLVVMPHGNYVGVYPPARPREVVLRELGLDPHLPVVGCVGMLRDYKGLDLAFEAVARLSGRVQLICAGGPHPSYDVEALRAKASGMSSAALVARSLSDQEFADYCAACDVMLFPYRKITGSGALLAALSLRRGVVASDLPYFRELLAGHPDAGVLVPPGDVAALARAIESFLAIDPSRRTIAARDLADQFAWEKVIPPVAAALQALRKPVHAQETARVA